MKKKLKFLWIDDEPQRRKFAAENMRDELNVEMSFVSVENQDIDKSLQSVVSTYSQPDLIIMDHYLNNTLSIGYKRGSTAATVLHEKWPECPIVSVTAVDIKRDVDTRQRSAYENMFADHKISDHYQTILSIANGFKKLKDNRPKNISELLDKFCCPSEDRERITKILPVEIKEDKNFTDQSLSIEVYRWFNSVLVARPGFLYDKLWAATYLGLTEKGFETVGKIFEPAKYQGVFSDSSNERWWKSQLSEIVAEKTNSVGLPWITGRELVKQKPDFFSKSFKTKKEFPEIVAALDESAGATWHPMRLEETEPHPQFEDMLFFEQLRVMK